ncbi:MAG TPA: hypothetical protein VF748_15000 [Candidatus Acidoferrum sp.]
MRQVRALVVALAALFLLSGQTTQQFPAYVNGLISATTPLTGGEQLYVLQNGVSRKTPVSSVFSSGVVQFLQSGTGAVLRPLQSKVQDSVCVSVTDFGADPTGILDSTTAIQNAINSLPAAAGTIPVCFPGGGAGYTISSQIVIGNGSISGQATQQGVRLVGFGNGGNATIFWNGAITTNEMFLVQGPMKGWEVSNLTFNCNNRAGGALKLSAASFGQSNHIAALNCTADNLHLTALASAVSGTPNSQFNTFNDYSIFLSNSANTIGILCDGNGVNASFNSSLNTFNNVNLVFPNVNTVMSGYYLRDCDGNLFTNATATGGGTSTSVFVFDYSGSSGGVWPGNNTVVHFDPDGLTGAATKYAVVSNPAAGARPNRFISVIDGNSAGYPKITNTTYTPEFVNPGVLLTGQTASFGATNINPVGLYVSGLYRLSWVLLTTTAGTGGTVSVTFTWTDDAQAETFTSSTLSLSAKGQLSGVQVVRALNATNIAFSTTVAGATGGPQYAIFTKLEKMD